MKKFEEIINNNKNEIVLGYNTAHDLLVDIYEYPSIVITGETGSGKSVLLDQILIQLINKHNSYEMGIMAIDTSGVELNYYENSNYILFSAINSPEKEEVVLSRVLREIDRRKEIFINNNTYSYQEYNKYNNKKLPLLVVAIDDDKMLLNKPDMEKMISAIINSAKDMGIFFIMATNNLFNKFFEKDNNLLSSVLISYDLASLDDTILNNLEGSDSLDIGKFICRKDDNVKIYYNYKFNDSIINEVIG